MPRKKQAQVVTLVGAKLPVSECLLLDESGDTYVVQAVEKKGRGRGVKTFRNTYTIPKAAVSYYFVSEEIEGEEADAVPVAAPKKAATRKSTAKKAAAKKAPKKRGRPKKADKEDGAEAAPKKRGRPKGAKNKKADSSSEDKSSKKKTIDALFGDNF